MPKLPKTPRSSRTVRGIRLSVAITLLAGLILLPGTLPAQAVSLPALKLISVEPNMTILRHSANISLPATPSVYVASSNGDFEIRATRPDYDTPVSLEQWVDGGAQKIPLPADMADGFRGLKDFMHVTVKDASNTSVYDQSQTFCPASGNRQRVDDSGVQVASFPSYGCGNNPFTMGSVWGIDSGWAVGALGPAGYSYYGYYGYYGGGIPGTDTRFLGPDGVYSIHVSIPQTYIDQFGINANDAFVNVTLTVQTKKSCSYICTDTAAASSVREPAAPQTQGPRVPTDLNPDPSTLPDLIPLPSYGMRVSHNKKDGHDYLQFGADVWNDGPAPMVVEGFRQSGLPVMDGYQYFYDHGVAVGRAPAGTLLYDSRPGHNHWHFQQFANYSLLDATQTEVVRSEKEAFCLAPTDPINLAADGAEWFPYSIGLDTACGSKDSIWTRESLDAGWGDTYFQGIPGQSFDVTHLPNGHYFVQVTANPNGVLYERNTANDTSLREIVLKGRKGSRKVVVLPYHGIQTG